MHTSCESRELYADPGIKAVGSLPPAAPKHAWAAHDVWTNVTLSNARTDPRGVPDIVHDVAQHLRSVACKAAPVSVDDSF